MAPVTTTKQTDKDADHLERVARLAPLMEESAAAIERDQRLPAALLEELHGARMFRLLLPEEFDGEEVMPSQFFEIVENVARHDASTAWCVCQGNGCAMTAAYLDPAAIS